MSTINGGNHSDLNFGGVDIVRVNVNGDADGEGGWDMAMQVNGLVGNGGACVQSHSLGAVSASWQII